MRGATECARRLKLLWSSLRSKLGKVSPPAITDPITQLILGVLSRDTPETKASEGLERLRGMVVDYNELRVIPPIELTATLGDFPDARLKCEDISRALNAVFAQEHTILLDRLGELPKRDVVAALERIDGLEPYTRARIRLLGLRHHAVPLDEAMWAVARAEAIVDPRCVLQEAQSFLERQIGEDDDLEFYALLKRHAWSEMGAAVRKREVERIVSVPPDRTARNMLQLIGRPFAPDAPGDDGEDAGGPPAPASVASATPGSSRRPGRPASAPAGRKPRARDAAETGARSKGGGRAASPARRRESKDAPQADRQRRSSKKDGGPSPQRGASGGRARKSGRTSKTERGGRGARKARSA